MGYHRKAFDCGVIALNGHLQQFETRVDAGLCAGRTATNYRLLLDQLPHDSKLGGYPDAHRVEV